MIGAIAGDIIGSIYEHRNIKTTRFPLFHPMCRFTDDTVLTVALAESILHGTPYVDLLKAYYRAYPRAGYGGTFHQWAQSEDTRPYNSWGNGSAMRVSPVGFAFDTIEDVRDRAKGSAEVTHDHPEGIKGAQSVASAVFLARTGQGKDQIKNYVETTFGYRLDRTPDEIPCIAGGIAQAYYGGVPEPIRLRVFEVLDDRLGDMTRAFSQKFACP